MPSGRLGSVGYAKLVYRDRSEWIAVKVPPIVPQELFDRVQELLQRDIGWVCQSLRLDIGRADYLRPLGGIRLDDDSKLLRRIEGRLKTELRDPLAHVS